MSSVKLRPERKTRAGRPAPPPLPPCTLYRLRLAARRATRFYEAAMQAAGISAAQFGVLSMLAARQGITVTDLALALDLDRTTLTRNLGPLAKAKLVAIGAGRDLRSRSVTLTAEGEARLKLSRTAWRQAQETLRARLGATATDELDDLLAVTIERLAR